MKDRKYLITYDEKTHGQWTSHHMHIEATSVQEAREAFDLWMAERQRLNPGVHIPHPFHIKVRLEKEVP